MIRVGHIVALFLLQCVHTSQLEVGVFLARLRGVFGNLAFGSLLGL